MFKHYSVLLNEAVEGLDIKENGIYVDCTLGGAGHSLEILKRLKNGKLYAFDQDNVALENAKEKLAEYSDKVVFIKSNFVNLKEKLAEHGVNEVDGVLYDLGVSSPQLDTPERGFSYNYDTRLDMRMDTDAKISAYEVVNEYSYYDLVKIFYRYGEENFSKQINELNDVLKGLKADFKATEEEVDDATQFKAMLLNVKDNGQKNEIVFNEDSKLEFKDVSSG